jgi:hypothetical protein
MHLVRGKKWYRYIDKHDKREEPQHWCDLTSDNGKLVVPKVSLIGYNAALCSQAGTMVSSVLEGFLICCAV